MFASRFKPVVEVLETRCLLSPGQLDYDFGVLGVVTVHTGAFGGFDFFNRVVIQSDGKIVTVDNTSTGGGSYGGDVRRFNTNGTPDASFGGGVVPIPFPAASNGGLALQSDGKILIAGQDDINAGPAESIALAVARLNADGSVDTSFGNQGVTVSMPGTFATDVTVQPDGKIVAVLGTGGSATTERPIAVRFNADGSLDTSFGSNGTASISLDQGVTFEGQSVLLQGDGKIVIGGHYDAGVVPGSGTGKTYFGLIRLQPDGSVDTSFGANGIALADFGEVDDLSRIVLQKDGKIVAAGESLDPTAFNSSGYADRDRMALARFNTDGTLDSSFGTGGEAVSSLFGYSKAYDVAIQSDGKIVAVGLSTVAYNANNPHYITVVRYNSDGTLDTSFGSNGVVADSFNPGLEFATGVALQADGNIVVSSESATGEALERYFAGPTPGEFGFTLNPYTVSATDTSLTVTVLRNNGSDGTASVDYATSDGTAHAGTDYTAVSGTLTFNDGAGASSQEQTFTIPIVHQAGAGDLTFHLTLSDPTGGATISSFIPAANVMIQNGDTNGGGGGGGGGGSGGGGGGLPPLPPGTDLSALVGIQVGRAGAKGGPLRRTVTIRNTSGVELQGPFWLVLDHLSPRIKLRHGAGTAHGGPFLAVNFGAFGPGASLTLTLNFGDPTGRPIRFTPDLLVPE